MKTKTNKTNFNKNQDILCQVVDVFLKNGVSKNEDIVAVCRNLNPDKLRGVKRSLTLKKRNSNKKINPSASTSLNKRMYFVPTNVGNKQMQMHQTKPTSLEDIIEQYLLINQLKRSMNV